jgi:predicted enzyme related to lactoylglutathione lyase
MARVTHFEVQSTNLETSWKFFEEVFGWQIQKWDGPGEYYLIITGPDTSPGIDGGLSRAANEMPDTINTLSVENIDEVLQQVPANGGEIAMAKMEIPGVGYLAYIREPGGTVFGLLQALPGARI